MEHIKKILLERGYTEQESQILSEDLFHLEDCLKPCLEKWLNDGSEKDFIQEPFSIKGLIEKFGMKYPAALLSINWVLKDPEYAIPLIEKGIR